MWNVWYFDRTHTLIQMRTDIHPYTQSERVDCAKVKRDKSRTEYTGEMKEIPNTPNALSHKSRQRYDTDTKWKMVVRKWSP